MESTDRTQILGVVLAQAGEIGIAEAVRKFGNSLPEVDKEALLSLSDAEITAASTLSETLSLIEAVSAPATNNNNNNKAAL